MGFDAMHLVDNGNDKTSSTYPRNSRFSASHKSSTFFIALSMPSGSSLRRRAAHSDSSSVEAIAADSSGSVTDVMPTVLMRMSAVPR